MTRREAAEKVFTFLKDDGFKPTDIKYTNGYYIFDMGKDSVVHFNIKGLHGWWFAMWLETDPEKLKGEKGEKYPTIQFFCQHKLNVDKFKPSTSFFKKEYYLEDIEDSKNVKTGKDLFWIFFQIENIVKMIKRHPFVSFAMDLRKDECCLKSYIAVYIKRVIYNTKQNLEEWSRDKWTKIWHGSKVWFVNKHKVIDTIKLIDHDAEDNGWKTYPRYEMQIHFKKVSDNEDEQNKTEINLLNKWFSKRYYKNMNIALTREGEEGGYTYK